MRISDWSSDVCSSDLESEPVAPGHQAAVSIDVAPLIGDEVTAILVVVVLGRGQTTVVWKHVRLQAHLGLADADDLLRKHTGGRILPAEGIECRNRTTIDGERNPDRKSTRLNSSH